MKGETHVLTFTHTKAAWYGNDCLPRDVRDELILNRTNGEDEDVGGDVLLRWHSHGMRVEAYADAFEVLGYFIPILKQIGSDATPQDVIALLLQNGVLDATVREMC